MNETPPQTAPTTAYRIQVDRFGEWVNVGPLYRDKETAKGWVSFVKAAWHGMPTRTVKIELLQPQLSA